MAATAMQRRILIVSFMSKILYEISLVHSKTKIGNFHINKKVQRVLLGSAFIGIANGIGVPYLNTIGSVKAGKEAATTVMPLLSAALYLGQFLSPLIVSPVASATGTSPYFVGVGIAALYLLQAILTRKKQMLPI